MNKRLEELNRSECIPFAFRLYAYYKVENRLSDKKVHELIDGLNPELRSVEYFGDIIHIDATNFFYQNDNNIWLKITDFIEKC